MGNPAAYCNKYDTSGHESMERMMGGTQTLNKAVMIAMIKRTIYFTLFLFCLILKSSSLAAGPFLVAVSFFAITPAS